MAKQNRQFLASLDKISASSAPSPIAAEPQVEQAAPRYSVPPSRQGKQLVAGHLPPQYRRTLKMLSAQTDISQEVLLQKALDMLFTAQRIDLQ